MHPTLLAIVWLLLLFGCVYMLAACWCLRRRLRARGRWPGLAAGTAPFRPPVSILKPLCGAEPRLIDNLKGFCRQDYPDYELLLGVQDRDDPATAIVEQLRKCFPKGPEIRLVVAPKLGANPKSAVLHHLAGEARHELLAISDSDIDVQPDYLRRVVAPLEDPAVGIVTCLYSIDARGAGLRGKLDALYVNFTFAPAATLACDLLKIPLALGATIVMRRRDLKRAGGYAAIADQLADDRHMALLHAGLGLKTVLSDVVVRHRVGRCSPRQWWRCEVRRARTLRVVEPHRYLAVPCMFVVLWAVLLVTISGGSPLAWIVLGATLALRLSTAWENRRVLDAPIPAYWLFLLPFRDLLDLLTWSLGMTGRCIIWRGKNYRLLRSGAMVALDPPPDNLPRRLIRRLDAFLRRRQRIIEFCDDPDCVFRIAWRTLEQPLTLRDGACLERGQRIGELHFWNEHIPRIRMAHGADIAWATRAIRGVESSLRMLAHHIESQPELSDIQAIHGTSVLDGAKVRRLMGSLGFEFTSPVEPGTPGAWLHRRGEDLLILGLRWVFNPLGRRGGLARPRQEVWMSRAALLERYGSASQRMRPVQGIVYPGSNHNVLKLDPDRHGLRARLHARKGHRQRK